MCAVPPLARNAATKAASAGLAAKLPSAMALSILGRSIHTMRPAPMFMWPTSEFPICPSGSPTSGPCAASCACGQLAQIRSKFGVCAECDGIRLARGIEPPAVQNAQNDRPHRSLHLFACSITCAPIPWQTARRCRRRTSGRCAPCRRLPPHDPAGTRSTECATRWSPSRAAGWPSAIDTPATTTEQSPPNIRRPSRPAACPTTGLPVSPRARAACLPLPSSSPPCPVPFSPMPASAW